MEVKQADCYVPLREVMSYGLIEWECVNSQILYDYQNPATYAGSVLGPIGGSWTYFGEGASNYNSPREGKI